MYTYKRERKREKTGWGDWRVDGNFGFVYAVFVFVQPQCSFFPFFFFIFSLFAIAAVVMNARAFLPPRPGLRIIPIIIRPEKFEICLPPNGIRFYGFRKKTFAYNRFNRTTRCHCTDIFKNFLNVGTDFFIITVPIVITF